MALAAIVRGAGLAGRVASRQKYLRDAQGRFAKAGPSELSQMVESVRTRSPKSGCGKGQYKSKECKAKSIAKAIQERGQASQRQSQFIRNYAGFR